MVGKGRLGKVRERERECGKFLATQLKNLLTNDDVSLHVVSNGTHAALITSAGLRLCRPWCIQKMRPLSKFRNY